MSASLGLVWTSLIIGVIGLSLLYRISNNNKGSIMYAVAMFLSIYLGMTSYFVVHHLLLSMLIGMSAGLLVPFLFQHPDPERVLHSGMQAIMGGMMGGMLSGMVPVAEWEILYRVGTLITFSFGLLLIYNLKVSHRYMAWFYHPIALLLLMSLMGGAVSLLHLPVPEMVPGHTH
ncbi:MULTISPECIES: hypothetical protein [Pontibacillus]|uniref:Uncharacterized protein n=1 Tax=Pontibacillus chungwhensis TaxID=265426 RepID=A0ABY8V581_9BACI|nr:MULTISPECIES: hypothetical protein [Pontibacillus]MCD5322458.1 hypothetical protein [Pontibacillus sp. HN14]WIF99744.1 hypothetical protein QNI29_08835 [Pontibacillus chungwhensis]